MCRGWLKALDTDVAGAFLSHPGLRPKVSPTCPSYRQVFGAEGSRQAKPWLSAGSGLCEGRTDVWDVWAARAQAGGTRAPGWLLCTAHSSALHRMALPSLQLISASELSAVFHKTRK